MNEIFAVRRKKLEKLQYFSHPSSKEPSYNPTAPTAGDLRRWLGGSPIKLVLQLAFCLGEGGACDALLTDIQFGMLLNVIPHDLLWTKNQPAG